MMTKRTIPAADQRCFDFALSGTPLPRRKSDPSDNLYLGLKPPPGDADRITGIAAALVSCLGPMALRMSSRCLHISLVSCGRHDGLPAPLIHKVCDLMKDFAGPPVDIAFDQLVRFGGNSVVLHSRTTNHALQALRRALLTRMTTLPVLRLANAKAFEPHMTVFHDEQWTPARRVDLIGWRAHEVVLVHSRAGLHTTLERWPLAGTAIDETHDPAQVNRCRDLFG